MVRFHCLFDGKIMVRQTIFLVFLWKRLVFPQNFWRALSDCKISQVNYV